MSGNWYERILGCGEADLLHYLMRHKQVQGSGIERDETKVIAGIQKGVPILQGDLNQEIVDYPDNSFDFVILSQTLQQVYDPATLIQSMLRIAEKGIVSFPNFSHWRIRLQLLLSGYAPVTRQLPYQWYDTPNIRVITILDFRKFIRKAGFHILQEAAIDTQDENRFGRVVTFLPNLRATYGIFLIGRGKGSDRAHQNPATGDSQNRRGGCGLDRPVGHPSGHHQHQSKRCVSLSGNEFSNVIACIGSHGPSSIFDALNLHWKRAFSGGKVF
uniref:Methionine biosynthesis protein MetW n=1 Tax=Desulfatirhabdium butyrativorans TaxID=340467 RepID=A0A7C4RR46_9BACT